MLSTNLKHLEKDEETQKVLKKNENVMICCGRGKSDNDAFKIIKNIISDRNQIVNENYFKCYRKSFLFIRKSHPDK